MASMREMNPPPKSERARPAARALIAVGAIALAGAGAPAFAQTPSAPAIQTGPLTLTFGGFAEFATI